METDIAVSKQKKSFSISKYFLLGPAVLLMLVFFVAPIILTFFYSFTDSALTGSGSQTANFVGIKNYISLFKDTKVAASIINTLVFLIGSSLIGQQLMGFIIALCMKNKNSNFRRIIGICVLTGWVIPEIIVAFCMMTFFGEHGTLNTILNAFHIPAVSWLYTHPMLSIIIANIWHGTAFSMLIYQAALDNVPKEIEEAATVDGANGFYKLIKITIPYIKDSIVTNMILNTLQTLGVFGLIYTMTGGGPGTKTTTLPILMYQQAFMNYQIGYGTAISMILLLIGVCLSIFYTKAMKISN